jgi:hypothetical protein
VLEGTADYMTRVPVGFGHLLCALDFHLATPREVAIVGAPGAEDAAALVRMVSRTYLPNTVLAFTRPEDADAAAEVVPLLQARTAIGGRATAYVCERFACQQPVTDPAELAAQLGIEVLG